MDIVISRSALLKAATTASSVVPTKQVLTVLSSLLMRAEGDSLHITGSSLDHEVEVRKSVEVKSEGRVTAPAKKLVEVARQLPDGPVSISSEQDRAVIRAGKARIALHAQPASDFPESPDLEWSDPLEVPVDLFERIGKQVTFAVSRDSHRPTLSGVGLEIKDQKLFAVGTDGHRLSALTLDAPGMEDLESIIVPVDFLKAVSAISDGVDSVQVVSDGTRIGARTEGGTVVSTLIAGTYPDWRRIARIPEETDTLRLDREIAEQALKRMKVVSSDQTNRITMTTGKPDSLTLRSTSQDLGSGEDVIPASFEGEGKAFGFNASYFLDALSHMDCHEVELDLQGSEQAIFLHPLNEDGERSGDHMLLLMPLRLVE